MTERKPTGVSFESWVEAQIRDAADRGEFDNLPGAGKPLPGAGEPDDEFWWVKGYLAREGLPTDALLPTSLQLRKQIERLSDTVRDLPSEQDVRDTVERLNLRITDSWRAESGPQVHIRPVDAEAVVRQWRADRSAAAAERAERAERAAAERAVPAERASTPAPRSGWWRRIARRRWRP